MRLCWGCDWGIDAMREILILSPYIRTTSAARRRMLKSSCTLSYISTPINHTISRVHSDAYRVLQGLPKPGRFYVGRDDLLCVGF